MLSDSDRSNRILWAIVGLGVAVAIQATQAHFLGGWSGLLAVGDTNLLRPIVEEQLPDLVVTSGGGHDGQRTFVMGLDPWANWAHQVIPSPSYRYRRILLPALASAFGTIQGQPLLFSLILFNAVALAVATALTSGIARARSMQFWAPLTVVLNVGLWLSLQVTSVDALAFALAVGGLLALFVGRDPLAVALLALAVLSKETYALIPLSIAAHLWIIGAQPRRAIVYLASLTPMGLWSVFLAARMPNPLETGDNLTWPIAGIVDGAAAWTLNPGRDIAFLAVTGIAAIVSIVLVIKQRRSLWSWLVFPWLMLALFSSDLVWGFGNNAARAFLPLMTFGFLGLLDRGETPTQLNTSRGLLV